jgi:hypothetical protein
MSESRTVLLFDHVRQVPPEGARPPRPLEEPEALEVDALVVAAQPLDGWLELRTMGVNFKNNLVLLNGEGLKSLQGPGHGSPARDAEERIEIPPGLLKPGINRVRFTSGRDVTGVGAAFDTYSIQSVRLTYRYADEVQGPRMEVLAGAGILVALAAVVLAWRRS